MDKEARKIVLEDRESVLSGMLWGGMYLDQGEFPNQSIRKIIRLVYDETVDEMNSLGMNKIEDDCEEDDNS